MTDPVRPVAAPFGKADAFALVQVAEQLVRSESVRVGEQGHNPQSAVAIQFAAGAWPAFVSAVQAARAKLGPDPAPAEASA